jgi:hypothetical protein
MGDRRVACMVLIEKPEGKIRFRINRRRIEYNIKMNLKEVYGGMDWIDVAQDRDRWWVLVDAV